MTGRVEGAWTVELPDEAATHRLGETLALALRPGDVLALHGALGAGKTTLARAILRAFSNQPGLEVPSPTFTLVQPYDGAGFRFPITHIDLYRINAPVEIDELGLDEALATGALLVEWPERAGDRLPGRPFDITLTLAGMLRRATISSTDRGIRARIERMAAVRRFLDATPYATAERTFLQGDASPRSYERLRLPDRSSLVLLNADAQPDRPVTPERKAYMAATHLARNEDLGPLLAIGAELARAGLSVPAVLAASIPDRIAILEDLGPAYIQENGAPVPERYAAATDVLAHMHARSWPEVAEGPYGARHTLPFYSHGAMAVEAELCVRHFMPALDGAPAPAAVSAAFVAAWAGPFDLLARTPRTWTLFDYHSPNLHWLAERDGLKRIGIIDVQDARLGPAAYDLVSLLQDARITVDPSLEAELYARYVGLRRGEPGLDPDAFAATYRICGAQRATRILGVFARLAVQDGKPHYLRHIPRISGYLDRCLGHPLLAEVRAWFEAHAPAEARLAFGARRGETCG